MAGEKIVELYSSVAAVAALEGLVTPAKARVALFVAFGLTVSSVSAQEPIKQDGIKKENKENKEARKEAKKEVKEAKKDAKEAKKDAKEHKKEK